MFHAALTATAPGYAVLYGISDNTRAWWDLEPAGRWATTPRTTPSSSRPRSRRVAETEDDRAEAAHVGGAFATSEFERPAFD